MDLDMLRAIMLGAAVVAAVLLVLVVKRLIRYFSDIGFLKYQLELATDEETYLALKEELSCMKLTLIPGINMERAGKIRRAFSKDNETDENDIYRLVTPSVFGILVCAICLAGSTFAWFNASSSTSAQMIVSADYNVAATVLRKSDNTPITLEKGVFDLPAGEYTLVLVSEGSATTGYCKLRFDGKYEVHTQQFPSEKYAPSSITVTLKLGSNTKLTVIPQWGESSSDSKLFHNGECTYSSEGTAVNAPDGEGTVPPESSFPETSETDTTVPETTVPETTVPETTPPVTTPPVTTEAVTTAPLDPDKYVVKSGDTLSKIASLYKTSVNKLKAYNKIGDDGKIYVGQVIYIPPKDYVIPKETTTEPEKTEPETTEKVTEPETTVPDTSAETTEPEVTQTEKATTTETSAPEVTTPEQTTKTTTEAVTTPEITETESPSDNGPEPETTV